MIISIIKFVVFIYWIATKEYIIIKILLYVMEQKEL